MSRIEARPSGASARMTAVTGRRVPRCAAGLELMLLTTVVLWALNLTVTRYILTHGLRAARVRDRPLRRRERRSSSASRWSPSGRSGSGRGDLALVAAAALCLWLNQLAFVYALEGDERLDDRADPRRDADLRGADRHPVRARARPAATLLARGRDLVCRCRARGARLRRRVSAATCAALRSGSHGGDVGGYSVAIAPLDGALLGVPDQRGRACRSAGC